MKLINNILFASLASLFLLPVLPALVVNVLVAFFGILVIIKFFKSKSRVFNLSLFASTSGLFICYLLSLMYTADMPYAMRKLSTALTLFLFPFLFSMLQPDFYLMIRKYLKEFFKIYVGATVLMVLISLISVYTMNDLPVNWNIRLGSVLNTYSSIYQLDALYVSIHVSLALLLTTYLYYISEKKWKAISAVLIIGFLFFILIGLSFKSTVVAFLISLGLLALKINKAKLWRLFFAGSAVIVVLVSFSKEVNHKFSELLIVKSENVGALSSINIRQAIDDCATELLPDAGITGHGIGDGKQIFQNCLGEHLPELAQIEYNTHNQFTAIILYSGYLALFIFLGSLLYNVVLTLNSDHAITLAVVLFFIVIMLSENILERQFGVMTYALFTSLLFMLNHSKIDQAKLVLSHEKVLNEIK